MEYFQLTTPQQNIWNLQKYYEDTAISNLCGAVFYKERRDSLLLQRAIRQFIENQSCMRLHFCESSCPKQYLSDQTDIDIPVLEFSSMDAFDQYAKAFAGEPLDLLSGTTFRFAVFYVEEKSGVLVVLSQSVIFCGQFNTYLPFSLPAPAVCFYSLSLSYFFPALWTKLRYSRAGDIFNAAHRTVFSG